MSDHRDGIIADMQKRAAEKGAEITALRKRVEELEEENGAIRDALRERTRQLDVIHAKSSLGHHLAAWWKGSW